MSAPDTAKNYKDTVLLPKTDFPMKADLVTREPQRLAKWQEGKLYQRIVAQSKGKPTFILHDGPPFANGDVHMGTALNKVLKDLIVKSKTMAGFHAPFIPGWDCHGLPIEFKVVKSAAGLTPVQIRTLSEAEARKYIDIQRTSFKRLGVFGDWENPYLTLDPGYESGILRTFGKAVEKGLVYRMKRPVLWSYGAQTALAEAEVEYKEKTSPAVFVKFALVTPPPGAEGASLVIWTTTPWTLPANLAIALHPEFDYVCGKFTHADGRSEKLVIAKSRLEGFAASTGFVLDAAHANDSFKGSALNGFEAQHPFLPRTSKVINTLFVTDDTGTGAVHIAPGHGADDYQAGREHGLDILSPVDAEGKFTAECGLPDFVGKHVFSSNDGIIEILTAKGAILGNEKYVHQYPHCWRSKTPIIFRAVEQFFIKIDAIREKALSEIDKVTWLPASSRNRIHGTVSGRPDWCISRQRTWGVPCPVFYDAKGEIIMRTDIIGKVADIVEKQGTNLWFEQNDAWWAEAVGLPADTKRGNDTLDVWIDSGCSHVSVLDRHPELHCPADLYIEATDQHRGWFQSSLMMSIVARDAAPYKSVITHGFVVDTSGKKISKSDQGTGKSSKPMTADHYYNKYGGDMVRLWVSSVDYQNEVPFSEELFQQTGESYRRIRNTFRVLLGNLHDAPNPGVPSTDSQISTDSDSKSPSEKSAKSADYTLIDRWILERLHAITAECVTAYAAYDFRKVFTVVNSFFATELSALYIDITKDRMYCDAANSPRRRATQAAIREITETLTKLIAPILAFTADEVWEHLGHTDSVHMEGFPQPNAAFAGTEATAAVEELLKVRVVIQQAIEKARQEKKIGSNLEATVALTLPAEGFTHPVFSDPATLHEFLILSDLQITRGTDLAAVVTESSHHKCARCWKHLPDVGTHDAHPTLCGRCVEAVG
ncbi:isoleucine--tRNA ligase [Prosthecobacter sp.]|uniref:isoleucine--tRNA ligase n=1 Tax=Prosthecobacter sp. TaxID=1965333 RepID=UPI002AB85041|nr:isoleucine--tRNA ligase [Prosthecobacter sp.]MDZ4402693.1 isoleucine--tRNA ligase [Prosthecobacter sp.]